VISDGEAGGGRSRSMAIEQRPLAANAGAQGRALTRATDALPCGAGPYGRALARATDALPHAGPDLVDAPSRVGARLALRGADQDRMDAPSRGRRDALPRGAGPYGRALARATRRPAPRGAGPCGRAVARGSTPCPRGPTRTLWTRPRAGDATPCPAGPDLMDAPSRVGRDDLPARARTRATKSRRQPRRWLTQASCDSCSRTVLSSRALSIGQTRRQSAAPSDSCSRLGRSSPRPPAGALELMLAPRTQQSSPARGGSRTPATSDEYTSGAMCCSTAIGHAR
jgi:hypothetical protein